MLVTTYHKTSIPKTANIFFSVSFEFHLLCLKITSEILLCYLHVNRHEICGLYIYVYTHTHILFLSKNQKTVDPLSIPFMIW